MKGTNYIALSVLFLVLTGLWSCSSQPPRETTFTQQAAVDVYFFHTRHKCETCDAIKAETTKALEAFPPDAVFLGFYNLDQESKELADAMGIKTLTLLVVQDSVHIDLTNEAYLYARSNPEKFREAIQMAIQPLLP